MQIKKDALFQTRLQPPVLFVARDTNIRENAAKILTAPAVSLVFRANVWLRQFVAMAIVSIG